jgi:hypothetical protein
MKAGKNLQRGMSFTGIILIIAAFLFAAILGMKLIPAYMHSAQIEHIFKAIVNDPEMQNAAVKDVRASYAKRATMDYITDITADDIEVSKDGSSLTLSAAYTVKIPVAGNITLVLEFNPSSTK